MNETDLCLPSGVPLPAPPIAEKRPVATTLHGDTRKDDYHWLRDKTDPAVLAHLKAENAYAVAVMRPTTAFQETLYREILSRIEETDLSVPYLRDGYFYYSRTEEGRPYRIHCRRRGSVDAPEEVILDLNSLAEGHDVWYGGALEVSDDGRLLAYVTAFAENGPATLQETLYVKDLQTGELLPDRIESFRSLAWGADHRTLFYTTEDPVTRRSYRFYRHTLGDKEPVLLYEEADDQFDVRAGRTRDRKYLLLACASTTSTEYRYLPADAADGEPRVLFPREDGHEYSVEHAGDRFILRTNDAARNFRLVTVPDRDPRRENWEEFLPYRPEVKIIAVHPFARHCVVSEREDGQQQIRVVDWHTRASYRVRFPEKLFAAGVMADETPDFASTAVRVSYQSLVTPESVYDIDLETGALTLLKRTGVPGYDPSLYGTERIFATAPDGAHVPISLVYRKDLRREGGNPTLLYGYGAYGFSDPPFFCSRRLALLDRGVLYATACPRGGGEMGEEWREAGRLEQKRNTFTDFIACAEHLVTEGYASPDRLAILGVSAGGLLMGAVTNMRPDLFRAVVMRDPFVDVLNSMLDASLPLTTTEYLEWGNPNEKEYYDVIKSYSPYDNIAARNYPAMLVRVSLNDFLVHYWEGTKYVTRLRERKTGDRVLLLKVNMGAGHGGSTNRYEALRETAFDIAFILTELGIAG